MGWFYRSDGTVAVGEIDARPPWSDFKGDGSNPWNGSYLTWARLMVDDRFDGPWHRKSRGHCISTIARCRKDF